MTALPVGATIGILGGGQLGRMLAQAAADLGFDAHIYCPEEDAPAARVSAQHWHAEYDDLDALKAFAKACDVVTLEFENIPAGAAEAIAMAGKPLRPGETSLTISQDRVEEKRYLNALGIKTADFVPIHARSQLGDALAAIGGRGVLKTRRDGYDGKGQVWLDDPAAIASAWRSVSGTPCILEAAVEFEREISVLVARSPAGEVTSWAPPQNIHKDGILLRSIVPSGADIKAEQSARQQAMKLAGALDHVGVLALEFFVLEDGALLANEFAPRVHNSGHWTPEACETGQFEQHIRAVAGWKLGDTHRLFDADMTNIIGPDLPTPDSLSSQEKLTLYGKRETRPGRKIGHIVQRLAQRTAPAKD